MRCIIINEEYYEVHTHWGWFRLDEGAYRDYLDGKLWISWAPGNRTLPKEEKQAEQPLPANVTQEALRLRDAVSKHNSFAFLQDHFPHVQHEIPYRQRMRDIPIEEMALSVRSSNGLMRAGAATFGKLWELLNRENGLRSVRNLGQKSEDEINHCFFTACYSLLTPREQAIFWQRVIDMNNVLVSA